MKRESRAMVAPVERDRNQSREVHAEEGEKSAEEYSMSPYRKPTQVERKRIPRPTGEGLLRNSAS